MAFLHFTSHRCRRRHRLTSTAAAAAAAAAAGGSRFYEPVECNRVVVLVVSYLLILGPF